MSNTDLAEGSFGAEGHSSSWNIYNSWGLPLQGVRSCCKRCRKITTPKIDPSKVEAPYVTYLSKEEDPGETDDGDGFIRGG